MVGGDLMLRSLVEMESVRPGRVLCRAYRCAKEPIGRALISVVGEGVMHSPGESLIAQGRGKDITERHPDQAFGRDLCYDKEAPLFQLIKSLLYAYASNVGTRYLVSLRWYAGREILHRLKAKHQIQSTKNTHKS